MDAQPTSQDREPASGLASLLTIGDMARRYGLTLRALRFYEDRGMLQPLRHGTTRLYDAQACARIEMILRGKHLGYTLGAIAGMLARPSATENGLAVEAGEVEAQIGRLERKRRELEVALKELRAVHGRLQGAPMPQTDAA